MPLHRDDDTGLWTGTVTDDERAVRVFAPAYVEALVRYLNAFDPLFSGAQKRNELEFLLSLFRVKGIEAPGWDPYQTTREAISSLLAVHGRLTATREDTVAARHLDLWLYGHIVEASEPYELIADLLEVVGGGHYTWGETSFPPKTSGAPQTPGEKIRILEQLALKVGLPATVVPLREVWNREIRNAIFHADYTLYGDEFRLTSQPRRTVSRKERMGLINRALAYHSALETVFNFYVSEYTAPKCIPNSEHFQGAPGLEWVVIVREGYGVAGVKDAWTDYDEEAGRMPLRIGQFYDDETILLDEDPRLAAR